MARLKQTTLPQARAENPASDPNELVRLADLLLLLAGKADVGQQWSYGDIWDFESGVRTYVPELVEDSSSVVWLEESGNLYAVVKARPNGGVELFADGVGVSFGTGEHQVARGNHTHDQLHEALTVAESQTLTLTLDGQELTAEVKTAGAGWVINESGLQLNIGTGSSQVARGDHTHEGLEDLHEALTVAESQTLTLTLNGQELTAEVKTAGAGWVINESGLQLNIGTGSNQLAAGNHTHALLHEALTVAESQTLTLTLNGQELTAEVELGSGLEATESGVQLRLQTQSGLVLNAYGLGVDFGVGTHQVARGDHTHNGLHDALTVAENYTIELTLAGQELAAELIISDYGGLLITESGVGNDFGTGQNQVARGNHTHDEFHEEVTVADSATVVFTLEGQEISAVVRLDGSPGPGRGLLGYSSAGLFVQLGESGNQAAPGNHTHSMATDVLGGFMSAEDKAKLDELVNIQPENTYTIELSLDESGILRGDVILQPDGGLIETATGLAVDLPVTASDTITFTYDAEDGLSGEVRFGPGLMVGESGLQINLEYLAENSVELSDETPPVLEVGQVPVVGEQNKAHRADSKFGLPGLATSGAHGFQDKEDKRRFDLTHSGGFNDAVTAIEIDCERELIYLIGDFTKYGNVGSTRIAAVKYNGTIDPLFAPGVSFSARPGHIKRHSGGDLLVGGTTAKLSYRGATAQWLHKLDRKGTPDPAFTSPSAIAATGGDTFLSLSPLSDGTMIVQSWQTVRHLSATGSTLTTKNGAQNLHNTVADGTDLYLMSRRAADFNGGLNPRAIKRLDYSAGTGTVVSEWSTNGGVGGEANASYAVLSPLGDFIIASNSLASGNGGGSSYAWNGGSASKHTGLYKIRKDGSEDPDWTIDMVVASDWPRPLAIDSKGRVYFTGDITEINGTTVTPWRLYRVDADGGGLVEFAGFNGTVHDAKLAGDDYLVVAGAFTQYGTLPAGRMLFMDADGRALPFIPSCKPTKMERRSINSASAPTELEMVCGKRFLAVEFDVAMPVYGSYAHPVILSRKHVVDGESMLLHFDMPASTAVTIDIYDNVASGTPILSFAGKATAVPLYAEFRLDPDTGSWRLLALGYLSDAATDNTKVAKAGDTMTGYLTLHANPVSAMHAVPMQYADLKLAKTGGTLSGLLDFSGTTHGGMRLNNLTTAQRDSLTVKPVGCPIWNTTTGRMEVWNGSLWQTFSLTSAELALYKENGTGGELYATGSNSAGIGSYGLASGVGAFVIGSNLAGNQNVASGNYSFAGGGTNLIANGAKSICLGGAGNIANGNWNVVLGGQNNGAAGTNSAIIAGVGHQVLAGQSVILGGAYGTVTADSQGFGVILGGYFTRLDQFGEVGAALYLDEELVAQGSSVRLVGKTTDDTPTAISPYFAATPIPLIVRQNRSVWKFELDVAALASDGRVKTWEITGALKRGNSGVASLAFVGEPTITPQWADSGVEAWDVALGLNTTTGAFEVEGIGEDALEIIWGGELKWLKMWAL